MSSEEATKQSATPSSQPKASAAAATTKSEPKQLDAKSLRSQSKTLRSVVTNGTQRSEINSHATRILSEQVRKETICRDAFEKNLHLLKKSRNPLAGELTARQDAQYLIPHHHRMRLKEDRERVLSNTALSVINSIDNKQRKSFGLFDTFKEESDDGTYLSEESRGSPVRWMRFKGTNDLRRRKDALQTELEQLERVVEYKSSWLVSSLKKQPATSYVV